MRAIDQRSNRHVVRSVDVKRRGRRVRRHGGGRRRQPLVQHQLSLGESDAVVIVATAIATA